MLRVAFGWLLPLVLRALSVSIDFEDHQPFRSVPSSFVGWQEKTRNSDLAGRRRIRYEGSVPKQPTNRDSKSNVSADDSLPQTQSNSAQNDSAKVEDDEVHDANDFDPIQHYSETKLGPFWQVVWPLAWLSFVAAVPFLSFRAELTHSFVGKIFGMLAWITLFGGYFSFTCIVEFSSWHWDQARALSGIECIYFMTNALTTVGYGDIVPAHGKGRILVALYIFGSLGVISLLFSMAVLQLVSHPKRRISELRNPGPMGMALGPPQSELVFPSFEPVLKSLFPLSVLTFAWIVFLHFDGDEQRTWTDSLYNALISYSTVGFGCITPVSQGGMVFASWFLIFGSLGLANILGLFSAWVTKVRIHEALEEKFEVERLTTPTVLLKLQSLSNDGVVNEADFVLACLWNNDFIEADDIVDLRGSWRMMIEPGEAMVHVAHIQRLILQEGRRSSNQSHLCGLV